MKFFSHKSPSKPSNRLDLWTYSIAFLLPVLIMICVLIGNGIYPFGDNSFLRTDMYHQYAPFFSEFYDKLTNGGNLFYTWDIGMGTNFTSLYGYYLSSPFNWLIFLCPQDLIIEFMTYLIVFKIGLAGLTFAVFLRGKTHTPDLGISFFAVCYALSAYLAAYNWNIMWLDSIWLAPLILLGIERLVKYHQCFLYCISLGLAILSNYYIGIMLCIFSVLYFLVLLVSTSPVQIETITLKSGFCLKKERSTQYGKIIFHFCLYSLLAGALAAILLIPEYQALSYTASSDITFPETWTSYFSVFEMLARHLVNVEVEIGLDHWPNIYSGIAVFLCLPLYFMAHKVPTVEKVAKGVLVFFMLFCFATNIPNFLWHGCHYPNSLPCRQSFLYTALLLSMCYEGYRELLEHKKSAIVAIFFGGTAFILLCEQLIDSEQYSFMVFYLSLLLLGLYALFAYLWNTRVLSSSTLAILTLIVLTVEMTMNTAYTSVTTVSRSTYLSYTDDYRDLIAKTQESDYGFYRFEKYARKTKNDGAWVGYPSISTFSSAAYGNMTDFYKALGMEGSMNAYSNNGITPLLNSLLNVKYILSSVPLEESSLMSYQDESGDGYLYKNNYTLSVGYMLPSSLEDMWDTDIYSAVNVQNDFSQLIVGEDTLYPIYDTSSDYGSLTINISEPTQIFVEVDNNDIEDVTATIGDASKDWSNVDRGFLLNLGVCNPDDTIILSTEDADDFDARVYGVNEDAVIQVVNELNKQQLEVTSYTDTSIDGTITVTEDGLFLLSIPYDPGWTLYVDGVETELSAFKDALLSTSLSAGTHQISLRYYPEGLTTGAMITAAAIIILLILFFISKSKKQNKRKVQLD